MKTSTAVVFCFIFFLLGAGMVLLINSIQADKKASQAQSEINEANLRDSLLTAENDSLKGLEKESQIYIGSLEESLAKKESDLANIHTRHEKNVVNIINLPLDSSIGLLRANLSHQVYH